MAAEDDGPQPAKGAERRTGRERRQRPPVTIDLTAAPVEPPPAEAAKAAESPTPPEPPRAAPPPEPPRMPPPASAAKGMGDDGWTRLALVGAAGGLAALILVLVLQGVGLLPAPGRNAANLAAEQARAASETAAALERRVSAVEMLTEGVAASRGAAQQLGDRVARLEAVDTTLAPRDQVMALSAQVAAMANRGDAAVTRDDLARLAERIGRIETAIASGSGPGGNAAASAVAVQNGRIDDAMASLKALSARIDTLETRLSAGPVAGTEAARNVALASLRRASENGAPFVADLDMAAALGLAPPDVSALRPLAEKGVPSAAAIAAEMPADAMLAATAAADPDAGFWSRLFGGVSGLVSVRPVGPVAGTDPPAIVSRMRAAADKRDLAGILKQREGLPQAGKDASAAWAAKARDRVAVDAMIARIAEASARPSGN